MSNITAASSSLPPTVSKRSMKHSSHVSTSHSTSANSHKCPRNRYGPPSSRRWGRPPRVSQRRRSRSWRSAALVGGRLRMQWGRRTLWFWARGNRWSMTIWGLCWIQWTSLLWEEEWVNDWGLGTRCRSVCEEHLILSVIRNSVTMATITNSTTCTKK